MNTNEYGLDVHYFKKNLERILRDIKQYKPSEMNRALTRLADTATNGFAKCKICGGFETIPMKHDASRWFCEDCKTTYLLE